MTEDSLADRHVLICDDDPSGAELVKVVLNEGGFRVSFAADGEAGLKAIRALKPAVVLLDLDMPVKSGLDVLTELQQSPLPEAPVVLVLSNHDSPALQELCKMLGARATLAKASVVPELIERLEKVLSERSARPS